MRKVIRFSISIVRICLNFFFWPEEPKIKDVAALKKLEEEVLNSERERVRNERTRKRKATKKDEPFVEEKKAKTPAKKKATPKPSPQRVPKAVTVEPAPTFGPLTPAAPRHDAFDQLQVQFDLASKEVLRLRDSERQALIRAERAETELATYKAAQESLNKYKDENTQWLKARIDNLEKKNN